MCNTRSHLQSSHKLLSSIFIFLSRRDVIWYFGIVLQDFIFIHNLKYQMIEIKSSMPSARTDATSIINYLNIINYILIVERFRIFILDHYL